MTHHMHQWRRAVKGFTARGAGCALALAATLLAPGIPARADDHLCLRDEPALSTPAPFGTAVEERTLAELRGGTRLTIDSTTGVVDGNSATGTVSGGNVISTGAFANSSGLPVVIQNSGNNVLIQSSTTVNVQIR